MKLKTKPAPKHPKSIEDWDEYYLVIALAVQTKSKDPKCQVGAVVVSSDNQVVATGFNGLARGVSDTEEILRGEEKLKLICHAETNAVFNAVRVGVPLKGSTIYVTKFPCLACCNAIIQAGITRIFTHDHRYWDDDPLDGKLEKHMGKRELLKQARIIVDAPFHPDFQFHSGFRPRKRVKLSWKRVDSAIGTNGTVKPGNGRHQTPVSGSNGN